jgi:hypothetical protein
MRDSSRAFVTNPSGGDTQTDSRIETESQIEKKVARNERKGSELTNEKKIKSGRE